MDLRAVLLLVLLCGSAAPALSAGRETVAGPIAADVTSVVDGDTLKVDARIWPGQVIRVSVRIRGVDAPELRGRCAEERAAALRAREVLLRFVADGQVSLVEISGDKYFGRVIADLVTPDGRHASDVLLGGGHARAYSGRTRSSWCG